jgi:hypothetical protein
MALPSLKQRADALKRLRVAIKSVQTATAAKHLQVAGLFSPQTEDWLAEAQAVLDELREHTKPSRNPVLARGMTGPNDYRTWLIGEEIPALQKRIFKAALHVTVYGEHARAKYGVSFVRSVLAVLGERGVTDETIKTFVSCARGSPERRRAKGSRECVCYITSRPHL